METAKPSSSSNSSIKIGIKSFIMAFVILLALMVISGVLTKVIQPGTFDRNSIDGRAVVVAGSYHLTDIPDYPVWRWFTSPFEVLVRPGNLTVITIIIFLIFVGGAFTILEDGGVLKALLDVVVRRFKDKKYLLMAVIIFIFMFLAAFLGIYESLVPLIVFIVPLAHSLGWDSMTGLGMSLLPLAFGFSAAVTNPFTIGVAQKIAELPLFSGAYLRIIFFAIVYVLVLLFVRRYAKKVDSDPAASLVYNEDIPVKQKFRSDEEHSGTSGNEITSLDKRLKSALLWFVICMGIAILFILVTSRMPAISDYAFPLMAFLFLIGGVGAGLFAGMSGGVARSFGKGALNMLPGVILIMMALSCQVIIDEGGITDTILHAAGTFIAGSSTYIAAFFIYLFTLVMNFFIGSASAKAFLMMPILSPLADLVGVTRQTAVLAFDFGDGFSNMLYPSNALLLIGLGFTVVSYPRWIRWTIKLQGIVFAISMVFLIIAVAIGFGPF
jgi:uncharacterized ion transporter superfamily protein YfcC